MEKSPDLSATDDRREKSPLLAILLPSRFLLRIVIVFGILHRRHFIASLSDAMQTRSRRLPMSAGPMKSFVTLTIEGSFPCLTLRPTHARRVCAGGRGEKRFHAHLQCAVQYAHCKYQYECLSVMLRGRRHTELARPRNQGGHLTNSRQHVRTTLS